VGTIEDIVVRHYGGAGLLDRIMAGLAAAGADLDDLRPEDLAPVDEFHIGGRKATAHAVAQLAPRADHHILDVGCGIGGTARYIAATFGSRVTGIDLTPDYVAAATVLTERTGLGDRATFQVASALAMPFADAAFDAAISLHVAMNIPDRVALYREIARVLRPGAAFVLYDVMQAGDGGLAFPLPWAQSAAASHLTTAEETRALLEAAGLTVRAVEDRTVFAREFFQRGLAAAAKGPPPLGIHLLMGANAREKIGNMVANLEAGRMAPVQMVAVRR